MRIGIYIGSFNPVHLGHIDVINYLLNNNYVDKVHVVPTLNYWNKQDLIDIKHRINMLKFYENDNIFIDSTNNKYIYTIELLEKLEEDYPSDSLILIIGADNIINFNKWKRYTDLLKYQIIIMNRNNIDITHYINKLGGKNFIVINDYPSINVSSSIIRKNLDNNYLDNRVLDYIKKNNLYNINKN